jgi:prepilin-type N-terminal cleavage/methylation domain-containing protein
MKHPGGHGFTLTEMAVTMAIVVVLAMLGYSSLVRLRPRAKVADVTADLTGLIHNARQNALATGHYTIVMFFPQQANSVRGVGRVVAYEDTGYLFFSTAGPAHPNFNAWDASSTAGVAAENLLGSIELPTGVTFGLGGVPAPTLAAPYSGATASKCNFCSSSGDERGAIVFDSRGRARFYSAADSPPLSLLSGTVAVSGSPDVAGYSMLLISPTTGAVRPYRG